MCLKDLDLIAANEQIHTPGFVNIVDEIWDLLFCLAHNTVPPVKKENCACVYIRGFIQIRKI